MTPLELVADAAPEQVGAFRRGLRRWLRAALDPDEHGADAEDRADDLVLAASEALENVVDHAYAATPTSGPMRLHAALDAGGVTIVVADEGHWLEPSTGPSSRGRGIALMRTLADTRVTPGEPGTVVTLRLRLQRAVAQA